ncbi:MAG TPA: [Fe-Fe] hydrogenase large subunit C-terminal domain-containing protein [Bacteroidales bacterium]|nr:[Fe-Fe] hydrogenase large subunit C-terminal domain-containing protein [Bacteroidales bacterium]
MAAFTRENPIVFTVKNLCKVCYTCVRECPVKAISIINGQAEVIPERCIACGNCVKVCSQNAKIYRQSGKGVISLLRSGATTVACLAPSFPAEFLEIDDYRILIGMIRNLGFDRVVEVSFGADLISKEYSKIFNDSGSKPTITSDCPAVVNYIEHYHPDLIEFLAPVASPAMAIAEVVKKKYGADTEMVFIGPCIAKKTESESFSEVLTFTELRELFAEHGITPDNAEASSFDGPHSGKGAVYPVNHGLLQSINRTEGLGKGEVVPAEGKSFFMEAIRNFEEGILKDQHLELLCCDGCIQGPGMTRKGGQFIKRKKISEYVASKMRSLNNNWEEEINQYSDIDLSRRFLACDTLLNEPSPDDVEKVLISMGRTTPSDMLNCGACGYEICRDHARAVAEGLADTEMCLPYAIEKLHESVKALNLSNRKLADTRQALKQSEKLASMGQVSAGIAHELNNPLGIISLYSSILKEELDRGSAVYEDIFIIDEQAEKCKKIVGGLLNFARKNQVKLEEYDIVNFIGHSFKSLILPDNISLVFEHDLKSRLMKIDPDQMMQALTNLYKNAIEAMDEGGTLTIRVEQKDNDIELSISDTGPGISEENRKKIFTPFFTTKEPGKGTGLGLPLAYGIVKMHKGKISVVSNSNKAKGATGTIVIITIPLNLGQ